MKIKFTNLGPLKEGTFDLNKKLILLTGPNKSGKSWVAYSLYGVMKDTTRVERPFSQKLIDELRNSKFIGNNIKKNGTESISLNISKFKYDLDDFFRNKLFSELQKMMNSRIVYYYLGNSKQDSPNNSIIELVFDDYCSIDTIFSNAIDKEIKRDFILYERDIKKRFDYNISNENNHSIAIVTDISNNDDFYKTQKRGILYNHGITTLLRPINFSGNPIDMNYVLCHNIISLYIDSYRRSVFFLPAERTFINQVAKELTDYKAYLFDQRKYSGEDNVDESADLAWAIREYMNFINRLEPINQSSDSLPKYIEIAQGRLANLIGGQLNVNDFGRIIYSEEEKPIPYHLTSSSIKMLSGLDFYLRFYMRMEVNHTIFIDEPELHLHADAQLEFAKLIGQMVNAGIQVVVSTHSELIIRQLNHLIYLNRPEAKDSPKWAEFCNEYDYQENDFLTPDDVAVYFFDGKGGCESLDIDETGFSVPTIQDVLKQMSAEIYTFNDEILPSESE